MATSATQGKHFEAEGSTLTIFGKKGANLGKTWAMNGFLGDILCEVDPAPVSPNIEKVIEQDRAAGNEEKIDSVRVNAHTAVRLWLEGALTREMLANAVEDDKTVTVTMPFGGKDRKVIIQSDSDTGYAFATYDANGEVV